MNHRTHLVLVIIFALAFGTISALVSNACHGAEAGTVVPRKDLPAAVAGTAKKAEKFPGIPACANGRLVTHDWPPSVEKDGHECAVASELYVCAAFGKISVRCE
jgi:hypothetical protein